MTEAQLKVSLDVLGHELKSETKTLFVPLYKAKIQKQDGKDN